MSTSHAEFAVISIEDVPFDKYASKYRMSCYTNIEKILADNGLTFFDASTIPSFPAETIYRGGELGIAGDREVALWRETAVSGVVEVTDTYSGRIYSLIGDITVAEDLALTIALSHVNNA